MQATDLPIDDIMAFDNQCFLIKNSTLRKPFLDHWIRVPGGSAFVAVDINNKVIGIGCRRPALQQNRHLIGPLYAIKGNIAHALIAHLSQDVIGDLLVLSIRYLFLLITNQHIFFFTNICYVWNLNNAE